MLADTEAVYFIKFLSGRFCCCPFKTVGVVSIKAENFLSVPAKNFPYDIVEYVNGICCVYYDSLFAVGFYLLTYGLYYLHVVTEIFHSVAYLSLRYACGNQNDVAIAEILIFGIADLCF